MQLVPMASSPDGLISARGGRGVHQRLSLHHHPSLHGGRQPPPWGRSLEEAPPPLTHNTPPHSPSAPQVQDKGLEALGLPEQHQMLCPLQMDVVGPDDEGQVGDALRVLCRAKRQEGLRGAEQESTRETEEEGVIVPPRIRWPEAGDTAERNRWRVMMHTDQNRQKKPNLSTVTANFRKNMVPDPPPTHTSPKSPIQGLSKYAPHTPTYGTLSGHK